MPSEAVTRALAKAKAKRPQPLLPGDSIEYSLSVEVKQGGIAAWVKVGVTSAVRNGESTAQAMDRIVDFVGNEVDDKVKQLKS